MSAEREADLRRLLIEIDERLLARLSGRRTVDEALLHDIALHDAARTAVLRLIAASQAAQA